MPTRHKPRTTEGRNNALRNAKTKKDNTPGQTVIQAATVTRLDLAEPELKALILASNTALQTQTDATGLLDPVFASCKMWYSHLIQHLNDAIARGEINQSVRANYGIAVSDPTVPEINSYDDLKTWGQLLIDGEAVRVAAGGTAMSFPSVADFNTLQFSPFNARLNTQSTAKVAYDDSLEDISNKNAEYDDLILRMWNEIELAFYNETPPSLRRNAREWGVVYTPNKGEKVKLTVPASSTVTAEDFDIDDDMEFKAKNTGTVTILLCRSTTAGSACTAGVSVAAGATVNFTSADLGATGQLLNATNGDATTEGKIEIERL
jgi:hypothetical protein